MASSLQKIVRRKFFSLDFYFVILVREIRVALSYLCKEYCIKICRVYLRIVNISEIFFYSYVCIASRFSVLCREIKCKDKGCK